MVNLDWRYLEKQKVLVDVIDEPRARRLRVSRLYGAINSYQVWIDDQLITANTSDDSAILHVAQILTGKDPYVGANFKKEKTDGEDQDS